MPWAGTHGTPTWNLEQFNPDRQIGQRPQGTLPKLHHSPLALGQELAIIYGNFMHTCAHICTVKCTRNSCSHVCISAQHSLCGEETAWARADSLACPSIDMGQTKLLLQCTVQLMIFMAWWLWGWLYGSEIEFMLYWMWTCCFSRHT